MEEEVGEIIVQSSGSDQTDPNFETLRTAHQRTTIPDCPPAQAGKGARRDWLGIGYGKFVNLLAPRGE